MNKIYVGNLSYETTEDGLRSHFMQYGNIDDLKLIMDRETGRSKGFGFITFDSDESGKSALDSNGTDIDGRQIRVNTAQEGGGSGGRRPGGNGGRGGYGGGGGRGGYGGGGGRGGDGGGGNYNR